MNRILKLPIESCIIVFVRAPQRGCVKTRLNKDLDADIVLALYKAFVADVLTMLETTQINIVIGFYPAQKEQDVKDWLGGQYSYFPQQGHDLGQRMADAFLQVFEDGVDKAVLIGTDFPDLPSSILKQSFDLLTSNHTVLGPATDGGYYLIGFSKDHFVPEAFTGIEWGGRTVFEQTLNKLKQKNKNVGVVETWKDIDYMEDLIDFYHKAKTNQLNVETFHFLERIDFESIIKLII